MLQDSKTNDTGNSVARGGVIGRFNRLITYHVRRRMGDEQGIAALEFGLLMPVLIILMLGAVELFLATTASRRLTRVTNTMGDLITQAKGVLSKSDIDGYYNAAQYIMGDFPISNTLAVSIYTFTVDDNTGNPKLSWKHHLGDFQCMSTTPTLTAEQESSMQDGNDLVIAYGCYKYKVSIGSLVLGNITLNMGDAVSLRPRQQLQVECSDCTS